VNDEHEHVYDDERTDVLGVPDGRPMTHTVWYCSLCGSEGPSLTTGVSEETFRRLLDG
jgi:hypothetical protein